MQLPVVGRVFEGQFRIDSLLGEGGFGAVYLARDSTERAVALKVVKPDENGDYSRQMRARFEREVRILAGLRNPHTVALYAHGQASGGLLYMVFEYIPGRDLTGYLDAVGRLDAQWVEHIMRQVLIALDEAHKAGLIHRDLKPDNIRIYEADGDPMRVKLLDFGIARATDDGHPSITKTGELIGTPRYMSPEQLKAQPLTPRSDIYSLGMVAIELLVGEHGLPGTSVGDQLARLVSSDFVNPELVSRAGPLLEIVRRMTAVAPEDRFPSAAAVLAAMDAPPPTARPLVAQKKTPPPSTDPLPTRARDHRLLAAIAAIVAIAAVIAAVVIRKPETAPPPVETSTRLDGLLKTAPAAPAPEPVTEPKLALGPEDLGMEELPQIDLPALGERIERPHPTRGCGRKHVAGTHRDGAHVVHIPKGYSPKTAHPAVLLLRMDRQSPTNCSRHRSGASSLTDTAS